MHALNALSLQTTLADPMSLFQVLVALCALLVVATAAPFTPLMYDFPLAYSAPVMAFKPRITTYSAKPVEKEVRNPNISR